MLMAYVFRLSQSKIYEAPLYNHDTEAYKAEIAKLGATGGGDADESAVDALETARLLDMRASSGKIFILVTDA